ncbi:MAG: hypothetical protein PHC66_03795 [Candidatus Nanoarchaeia archaeon]|nr:hypothetical protein [Candidatus Nanoarchaeia archaeon]MDD5239218.1 hypothetical protein [Candidatus Nanoarchaeia archaeon]
MEFLFGFFAELFNFLLSFLLVFALFYGVLSKTKFLTGSATINSVIAFVIGLLFAFSGAFKYMVQIIPYFALLIILLAAIFLILFLLGFKMETFMQKENEKTTKILIWTITIISIAFVFFAGWKIYYDDVHEMYELYSLQNTTLIESELSANLTGNPFHDIPLRYEYHCTLQGRYLAPILFFGQGGILCLVMHPRVIGVMITIPLLALIVFIVSRWNLPKK